MKSFTNRWLGALTAGVLLVGFTFIPAASTEAASYRTISAQLRHQTPLWMQFRKSSGHPIGCGPAAWAIVFGYWKQFKGAGALLPGVNMPHTQVLNDTALESAMLEIARDAGTTYGQYRGNKFGRSMPRNMCGGQRYAQRRGYRTRCYRIRGTEFDKFRQVKRWLDQDKPVIILINDPARAFSSLHYPVIEKAELKQKKVLGRWRDRDVRYYVNFANGERKWIWVREVGVNRHPHTGSFSMFLFDITSASAPPAGTSRDVNLANCQRWCRRHPRCVKCSRLPGCGIGFRRMASFLRGGRNWYACRRR